MLGKIADGGRQVIEMTPSLLEVRGISPFEL